ncbi:MAG: hypothetical protein QOF55_2598 [Thermoleophilaceae bacterium]|nr:hypothetical protein [Thermoleophilaceae bacterium]
MIRRAAALSLLAALALPAAAAAGPIVDRAASCLERRPVCVDPAARGELSHAQARSVAREIERTGAGPMFVAVLPVAALREVAGPPSKLLTVLHDRLGRRGTYAVVAGGSFRAAATRGFPHAVPLANQAFDAHSGEGVDAMLTDFVHRLADARNGGTGSDTRVTGGGGGGGSSGVGGGGDSTSLLLIGLGVLGLGGGAVFVSGRRQRRLREERERRDLAEVKHVARGGRGDF